MNYYTINKTYKLTNYTHISWNIYFLSINARYSTKHYVPGNKEWKDSVYSYNKNYLKVLPAYNNISNNLIATHFNLTNLKNTAISKRMRDLILKKSSKKIFISKPFIKHNNDKAIINLYTFNRQKEFLIRKLFFCKRKYNLFKQWMTNTIVKKIKVNKSTLKNTLKKKVFHNIIIRHKKLFTIKTKKRIPYYGINYKNELDYLIYKTSNIYRKLLYFNNIFIFMFFRKLLYLFNINLFIPIKGNGNKNVEENAIKDSLYLSKNTVVKNAFRKILFNRPNKIMWLNKKTNLLNISDKKFLTETLIKKIIFEYNYNYDDLILLNKRIFHYIENRFIKKGLYDKSDIINMYIKFKIKYYKKLIVNFFKEESTILHHLNDLELNILKFNKLLYNIKIMITRIYNKKVELNITNLKYPFLNSEIYNKIIINKAAKSINSNRLLGLSLALYNLPKEISNTQSNNINSNSTSKLSLTDHLYELYKTNLINKKTKLDKYSNNDKNKTIDILNTIKFKWVTGFWLQMAGRVTKRFTASRSISTIKHKGSLKNEKYYVKDGELKPVSSAIIRNTIRSNSQYTSMGSKKRIGSFGIKSWITSH